MAIIGTPGACRSDTAMNDFRKWTRGPETKHRYKVDYGEGNPHTITISVRKLSGAVPVYQDCYLGGWRHICNMEPMFTREQAAKQTLDLVEAYYEERGDPDHD